MKNNGELAFPQAIPNGPDEGSTYHFGLTARDYFAAKFAPTVWASFPDNIDPFQACQQTATMAYYLADAMLAERSKP